MFVSEGDLYGRQISVSQLRHRCRVLYSVQNELAEANTALRTFSKVKIPLFAGGFSTASDSAETNCVRRSTLLRQNDGKRSTDSLRFGAALKRSHRVALHDDISTNADAPPIPT